VLGQFELDEHELTLLRQAVAVADLCDDLQRVLDKDGPLVATKDGGSRVHPASVELRLQRLLLARLIVALRVPLGEEEDQARTQRRGMRGVYGLRGGAA